jgi:predicted dinucleotide-binding enzyme
LSYTTPQANSSESSTFSPASGEIVVLAVPYPAITEVLAQRKDELVGKVVVDISNPLDFETFDALVVPPDSSVAATLPRSCVLKAFNTTFAATLAAGTIGGCPTTVLIAGDDHHATSLLVEVVTAGGLRAVDAGALKRAREIEALGFLQLTLAAGERISWSGGFAVVP